MLAFLISFLFTFPTKDSVKTEHQHANSPISHLSDTIANRYLLIDNIFIIGNKITKDHIILREMSITRGEYFNEADLKAIMVSDQRKIVNTRLFNTVEITLLELSTNKVDIIVRVSERWYTFPAPIFDLIDRNFNDWWQNQDHDLSRVNYGLRLYRNNMRGRNETLGLQFQFGFTRQFNISYKIPYIDRSQRHGLSFNYLYAENKSIPYETVEHKRLFIDSEHLLKLQQTYSVGYQFRNSFYTTHAVNISFNDNEVSDTVATVNPEYFLNSRTKQRFISLIYDLSIDRRDFNSYPLKGYRLNLYASKHGFGNFDDINQFDIGFNVSKFSDLGKGYYLANYTSLYASGPGRQPYANLRGLGYRKDFIRGYELYVVEGQTFYLNRATFKKRLLKTKMRLGVMPFEQFRNFPLSIYLKTYFDMGYVENLESYEDNIRLTNRFLFGTGLGLDIVSYYDTVIRFEYSLNREQEAGLFIHFKKEF